MYWLALFSIVPLLCYTAAVLLKYGGVPESISATFYKIEHKFFFGLVMVMAGAFVMPPMLSVTPESWQFLCFLTTLGFLMVGSAPNFREGIEKWIHGSGATVLLIATQVWVGIMNVPFLLGWIPCALWLTYNVVRYNSLERSKSMFWIEVTAIATSYTTLFLLL